MSGRGISKAGKTLEKKTRNSRVEKEKTTKK